MGNRPGKEGIGIMDKFFGNLHAVLGVGLVLAIGLMFAPYYAPPTIWLGVFQWLHVFFGITWIGLLYYFNFVQIPTMPKIPAELKTGVSKYIAPKALFFFRWGAAFTVLTGLVLAWLYGVAGEALLLQRTVRADRHRHVAGADHVVQRLVHHLAEPEEGARPGRGRRCEPRPRPPGPRCSSAGSTPCCRSRCCSR